MKKKLLELYRIIEGPFDDINKSLSGAKSVARDPRAQQQQQQQSQARDPSLSKTQSDLNRSKSIFDEATGDDQYALALNQDEIEDIKDWAEQHGAPELLTKINAAMAAVGGNKTGGSSMSMSRTTKTGF